MRRRFSSVLVLTIVALVLGTLPATALTTTPDATPWMANGYIKASAQYGNVLFVGGSFQKIGAVGLAGSEPRARSSTATRASPRST